MLTICLKNYASYKTNNETSDGLNNSGLKDVSREFADLMASELVLPKYATKVAAFRNRKNFLGFLITNSIYPNYFGNQSLLNTLLK